MGPRRQPRARCTRHRSRRRTILLLHQTEHQITPRAGIHRVTRRRQAIGCTNHRGQRGRFSEGQLAGILAEMEPGGGTDPVECVPPILPEIDLVQVRLKNLGLAVTRLERDRHRRLAQLAHRRPTSVEEEVLRELLGNRAAALRDPTSLHIGGHCTADATQIESMMRQEPLVLHREDRINQGRRKLIERDWLPTLTRRILDRRNFNGGRTRPVPRHRPGDQGRRHPIADRAKARSDQGLGRHPDGSEHRDRQDDAHNDARADSLPESPHPSCCALLEIGPSHHAMPPVTSSLPDDGHRLWVSCCNSGTSTRVGHPTNHRPISVLAVATVAQSTTPQRVSSRTTLSGHAGSVAMLVSS